MTSLPLLSDDLQGTNKEGRDVLIGIDMLGVQWPEESYRPSGRYTRQLVTALLAFDNHNHYVLYSHEGLPTDRFPSSSGAQLVSLAPETAGSDRLRSSTQRIIDENPDGLDWLVSLNAFGPDHGGLPLVAPRNGLRVASLVPDLSRRLVDRRQLNPLRRHQAILTISEASASECRKRLGLPTGRVTALGLAIDPTEQTRETPGRQSTTDDDDLDLLGITGPFLLTNVFPGDVRASLISILDAYRSLPFEHRMRQQLVIANAVEDPWSVVAYLNAHACADGLILVGKVSERTSRLLYSRCSAYLSPAINDTSSLALVEAMSLGAVVLAGESPALSSIVGDAGLMVDPSNPSAIAEELSILLSAIDFSTDLRLRAKARSARFSWEPVVEALLGGLASSENSLTSTRSRVDFAHVTRPRIAIFADFPRDEATRADLGRQLLLNWYEAFDIDFYLEPGSFGLLDRIPPDRGFFDIRQFEGNDGILSYDAVVYHFSDLECLELRLGWLKRRPGLVVLLEEIDLPPLDSRIRDAFLTSSRVVVPSRRLFDQIHDSFPEFADRLIELPGICTLGHVRSLDSGCIGNPILEQIERCSVDLGLGSGARPRPLINGSRQGGSSPLIGRSSVD